jgi:hypothetical protein
MGMLHCVWISLAGASTSQERRRGLESFHNGPNWSFFENPLFQIFFVSILVLIGVIVFVVYRYQKERARKHLARQFDEECNQRGLTAQEREILEVIVQKAGLRRPTTIFTMVTAFNIGASKLMQEHFASGETIVQRKKFNASINSIREKLGFSSHRNAYGTSKRGRNKGLSSQNLAVGKVVSLGLAGRGENQRIEGVIAKNDEYELVIKPEVPVLCNPGETWNIRYQFGASTWEFDALTMACSDEGLELSHSDNVRFINRRRFLRAVVKKPAIITPFPTCRSGHTPYPTAPVFSHAMITELSGPGLRIRSDLDVKPGDRLLVVFELEQGRWIQDMAEVRGIRDTIAGQSIGVELIGLNERAVNDLIRVTNQIAIQQGITDDISEEDVVQSRGETSS